MTIPGMIYPSEVYTVELRTEAHRICKLINKDLSCDFEGFERPGTSHDWACDFTCTWLIDIDKAPASIWSSQK